MKGNTYTYIVTDKKKSTKAIIIVPLYKKIPDQLDLFSIQQCFDVLGKNFDIYAIKPQNLALDNYRLPFDGIESFPDSYFKSIDNYNKLMLLSAFYDRFRTYEYMLIYQTDAFVFKDELSYWCNQDYDYIGAPWRYTTYPNVIMETKKDILGYWHRKNNIKQKDTGLPTERQFVNRVGNGGFSLRRIELFYQLCKRHTQTINYFNNQSNYHFNEDVFWGIELNRKRKTLKLPSAKVAINFSIENGAEEALKKLNGKLPFGCHAWDKNIHIWKPVFDNLGYNKLPINNAYISF